MGEDRCVCCGTIIPEGKLVCPECTNKKWYDENNKDLRVKPVMKTFFHCYCGKCGKRIPLEIRARYCHKCGTRIDWRGIKND